MKQANMQVAAPGFLGVNSEESPTALPEGWCSIADNAVIDSNGRIASRKGYRILTADNTALGSEKINEIHEANYVDGTTMLFAVGNNKIFSFDSAGVLTDITPGAATITADMWQIATLNDDTFFFQAGHDPIVYDKSAGTCTLVSAHVNYSGSVPQADCVVSAYGRVWTGGVSGSSAILQWSDLLIGAAWTGGSSGQLDLTNLWPTGNDEIIALAAHNAAIIVFGRNNILLFGSSAVDGQLGDPNTDIFLNDTVAHIGCISKYGATAVGSDLWFIDDTGVRSLGRTIQEKSVPIGDITANVRSQFKTEIRLETNRPRLVYDADNAFVLCILEGLPHVYVFDARGLMENGAARTTMWTGLPFACAKRLVDGTIYMGDNNGINKYQGYFDGADSLGENGSTFRMRYYFHPQTFGVPSNLKIPKEVDFTIGGGLGLTATCYWGFGYTYIFKSQVFTLDSITPDFYNIDEYNDTTTSDPTEYGSGSTIGRYSIPLSSSGTALVIGLEVNVGGQKVSIQEINIQTKIGRML